MGKHPKADPSVSKVPAALSAVQKKRDEMFQAVGAAMSTWQTVETALYFLYERAITPQRPGAAACGFHTLQFAGKIMVVESAVKFALLSAPDNQREALNKEWEDLVQKARNLNTHRNYFAHFVAFEVFKDVDDRNMLLQPPSFDARYGAGLKAKKQYTANDIKVCGDNFITFHHTLVAFLAKIPPPKQQLSAS